MLIMQVNGAHASLFGRPLGNLRQMEICARGETNLPGWTKLKLVARAVNDPTQAVFEFVGNPPPPAPPGSGGIAVTEKVFAGAELVVPASITHVTVIAGNNKITVPVEVGPVVAIEREGSGSDIAGPVPPPWPTWPGSDKPLPYDGMGLMEPPAGFSEALGKGKYAAIRMGNEILLHASGTLGNRNAVADLRIHTRAWPPRFALWVYSPEITIPATRDFAFAQRFFFPPDVDSVIVYDADGEHEVPVLTPLLGEPPLPRGTKQIDAAIQTGQGHTLEAAIESAIAGFPEVGHAADLLFRYDVTGSGKLVGGIAGLDLWFAKVTRTQEG
jgi:hypothetical protein